MNFYQSDILNDWDRDKFDLGLGNYVDLAPDPILRNREMGDIPIDAQIRRPIPSDASAWNRANWADAYPDVKEFIKVLSDDSGLQDALDMMSGMGGITRLSDVAKTALKAGTPYTKLLDRLSNDSRLFDIPDIPNTTKQPLVAKGASLPALSSNMDVRGAGGYYAPPMLLSLVELQDTPNSMGDFIAVKGNAVDSIKHEYLHHMMQSMKPDFDKFIDPKRNELRNELLEMFYPGAYKTNAFDDLNQKVTDVFANMRDPLLGERTRKWLDDLYRDRITGSRLLPSILGEEAIARSTGSVSPWLMTAPSISAGKKNAEAIISQILEQPKIGELVEKNLEHIPPHVLESFGQANVDILPPAETFKATRPFPWKDWHGSLEDIGPILEGSPPSVKAKIAEILHGMTPVALSTNDYKKIGKQMQDWTRQRRAGQPIPAPTGSALWEAIKKYWRE